MTTYTPNNSLIERILKYNLMMIAFMVLVGPFYLEWRNGSKFEPDQTFFIISIGVIILMNVPSIALYLDYYKENKNMAVELDFTSKKIAIIEKGLKKEYSTDQIEQSIYNLGIYYKNKIDKANRIYGMTSDFGYWDVKFSNGDRFYLSNLLLDFLHDTPKVINTKYRFRLFPFIDKSNSKEAIEFKEIQEKTRVDKFIERYSGKSEIELNYILENKKDFQAEAVKAAEILMNKNNVG